MDINLWQNSCKSPNWQKYCCLLQCSLSCVVTSLALLGYFRDP
jgi:hypothetical protein